MKGIVYRNHRKDSGWWWSRYTLEGDRLMPGFVAERVEAMGVEAVMEEYSITKEQVETAVAWLSMKRQARCCARHHLVGDPCEVCDR